MSVIKLECAIVRGGTTKGVFIDRTQLPENEDQRDQVILSLFGSPDVRQINGLGGGDPLTSKVALINRSPEPGIDIDYQSGEVGIDEASINYSTMCGNLASGAALFALEMGLAKKQSPFSEVKIRNLNTGKYLTAMIPMEADDFVFKLCKDVDGVAGYGNEVNLRFNDPAGSITGSLLPTGEAVDQIQINEKVFACSIVDCGTLYAFFDAKSFALSGHESPAQLDAKEEFKELVEQLREAVANKVSTRQKTEYLAKQIKIAIFTFNDEKQNPVSGEVTARVINRYKTHKAYPVTGAICISAATMISGSLLYADDNSEINTKSMRIQHPSGVIVTETAIEKQDEHFKIRYTMINRTANLLVKGVSRVVVAD
ncbi:MAG: hypothetical protein OEZ58_20545 [Gammaproteobacteria bacterium]|nr:hypothetical protein [Gammaproteobacteria bacterium]MDH5731382.1 hypothetical protein [Gammaproteobacteria bacterium]